MNIFKKDISYSKQKIKNNLLKQRIFIFCCIIYIIFFILYIKNTSFPKDENSLLIMFSMLLGLLIGLLLVWVNNITDSFFKKTDSEIDKGINGRDGEDKTYLSLIKILNHDYKVIPNFKIKNTRFDFDFLILGPKGLIAVETKNSSYNYIFEEDRIIKYKISRYSRTDTILCGKIDYRKKLINRCKYLESLINTNEISGVKIRKLLVFVNSHVEIRGKPKVFVVKNLNELSSYFNTLQEDSRFTKDFCEIINKKIQSLR